MPLSEVAPPSGALRRFFRRFGKKLIREVLQVVCDMHDPYLKAIQQMLSQEMVVFGRFHVMKLPHRAMDDLSRLITGRLLTQT
jgi:transposase